MTKFLVKYGELTLKKGNRAYFEKRLRANLRCALRGSGALIESRHDRLFINVDNARSAFVENVLNTSFGISSWSKVAHCEKTQEAICALCVETARELSAKGITRFKIEARRADKSFPLDSYGIMRQAGSAVERACPELVVDVKNPERVIEVEVRDRVYIYGDEQPGQRGLPLGTAGKGVILLSGGIDSPVAAYIMAKRGLKLHAVHFHAYPYTAPESQEKVRCLSALLSRYNLGMKLSSIGFAETQLRIKQNASEDWTTILIRMAMLRCAERVARACGASCLITGDSLCQVASQTVENLGCMETVTTLPVFRPLIGMDKLDTIALARQIGSYDLSVLPYADCCTLFSPTHPVLRASAEAAARLFQSLEIEQLLDKAFLEAKTEEFWYPPMTRE